MRYCVLVCVVWMGFGIDAFAQTIGQPRLTVTANKPKNLLAPSLPAPASDPAANSPLPKYRKTGFLLDRLSPKDQQRWFALEQFVFLQTEDGQYKHPTLMALWEWIETSGHAIYIEMPQTKSVISSTAGLFKIEALDPRGESHTAVIQLNLSNIDMAAAKQEMRAAGFMPFDSLTKEERYAEVLGHEMAHAADILTSLEKTSKVDETVEQTNALLLHHRSLNPNEKLALDIQERLSHRDALLRTLEAAAERMEAAVWREISAGKSLPSARGSR